MQETLFKDFSHIAADEMLFKYISYLSSGRALCAAEQTISVTILVRFNIRNNSVDFIRIWNSASGDFI